ncbi:LytR/AlgR family response regulator transcription factor [Roseivirga echinicomitans]|uniref:Two-component system response regulator n=1 Tax=Roseivirga echinicomitans TaxID=296218 RepID=A0A150XNC2_9BACT|nr:response regulator [Roseivirga echinicomitans]KYG80203.1 hypothetical protein AWN68_17010 [Roseivirga echinicomitans]
MYVLIVEDDPNYSDTLEMFIDELGYQVVGVAQEGKIALNLFKSSKPDMVLMDINLNGEMTGIDLAKEIQSIQHTPIIFITSLDDKETFERAKTTGPYGYLIKPFDPDTLERSMELALQRAHSEDTKVFDKAESVALAKNAFFVKERNRLVKVEINKILWVEVEDKYINLFTENRKYTLRQSLKDLAEKLDSTIFVQTHRSYIVNASKIQDIDLQLYVIRINETETPLGKSYKEGLIQRLQML